MNHLPSDQEEADNKMVLHALDATANGAMELYIHSPDTDVGCASKALSRSLCKTSFVFTTGDNHRVIGLRPIASALGSVKLAALPAFHAFIGADITGRFSVKRELFLFWKTFMDAENTITALGSLGATVLPPRRDIGPFGEVYKPSLSALNRCLKSQGTKMVYIYIQKKSGGIG